MWPQLILCKVLLRHHRIGWIRSAYCAQWDNVPLCPVGFEGQAKTWRLVMPLPVLQMYRHHRNGGSGSILCKVGQCPTVPSRLCRTSKDMASSHASACPTGCAPSPPGREGQVTLLNTVVDTIFSRLGIAG